MNKRQIALLGSTGSIGTQALDVVRDNTDRFEIYALVARQNVDLLAQQAREFRPEVVVIADEQYYAPLKEALADLPMKVWAGADAIADVVQMTPVDVVLTAMVGYAGLRPTLAALEAGKAVALANKETLVVAGELVTATARRTGAPILGAFGHLPMPRRTRCERGGEGDPHGLWRTFPHNAARGVGRRHSG